MTQTKVKHDAAYNERNKAKAIAKWIRRLAAGKPTRGYARRHHREAFPKTRKPDEVLTEK